MAVPVFALGASLLAFWAVARFPAVGPQSVRAALLLTVAAFVVQTPVLGLVSPVINAYGVPAALLLVILPSLTLLFWAAGCLVRSLVTLAAPYRS
jgi:hypothetical protein